MTATKCDGHIYTLIDGKHFFNGSCIFTVINKEKVEKLLDSLCDDDEAFGVFLVIACGKSDDLVTVECRYSCIIQ